MSLNRTMQELKYGIGNTHGIPTNTLNRTMQELKLAWIEGLSVPLKPLIAPCRN